MALKGDATDIARYFVKDGLGQLTVTAVSLDDMSLAYHRFDSDTGERIEDEEMEVDYYAIVAERNAAEALVVATQARADALNNLIDDLVGHLPP